MYNHGKRAVFAKKHDKFRIIIFNHRYFLACALILGMKLKGLANLFFILSIDI